MIQFAIKAIYKNVGVNPGNFLEISAVLDWLVAIVEGELDGDGISLGYLIRFVSRGLEIRDERVLV